MYLIPLCILYTCMKLSLTMEIANGQWPRMLPTNMINICTSFRLTNIIG